MHSLLSKSLGRAAFRSGSFCWQLELICWKSLCEIQMNSSRNSLELVSAHEDSRSVMVWLLIFRATFPKFQRQDFENGMILLLLHSTTYMDWFAFTENSGCSLMLCNMGGAMALFSTTWEVLLCSLILFICLIDVASFSSMRSPNNVNFSPLIYCVLTTSLWGKLSCECDWLKITQ